MEKIKLLSIVGTDRSGSTLLDKIISANADMISMGEVHKLIYYLRQDYPCACGAPFSQCVFWQNVMQSLQQTDFDGREIDVLGWRKRVKLLLQFLVLPQSYMRKKYRVFAQCYAQLYRAVLDEAKAGYIVDSCKDIVRSYLLHQSGLFDTKLIYITRPVEDYAVSVRTPQMLLDKNRKTGRYKAVLRWTYRNWETRFMINKIDPDYTQISYKRLASNPSEVLDKISQKLQIPMKYDKEMVEEAQYHFLGGNFMKFKKFEGIKLDLKKSEKLFCSWPTGKCIVGLNKYFVRNNI